MSHINSVRDYLKKVEGARGADHLGVYSEGPENCGHGNHKDYFQGCILKKSKHKNQAYLVIGYQNKVTKEDLEKILTASNTNKNRNNNTASDHGLGIDVLFWKYAKEVILLTYDDQKIKGFHLTIWDTEKQINKLKQLEENEKRDSINQIAERYTKRWENVEEEELPTKITQLFEKIKQTCTNNKIIYPKFMIFLLLRDEYQPSSTTPFDACEIYKEQIECEKFYAKKYYDLPIDFYFIKGEIDNEEKLLITKLKKINILGNTFKQDTIKCKVKIFQKEGESSGVSELTLIKFESEKKTPHYFALRPNGVRPAYFQNLCNEDGDILEDVREKWIKKIKEANDKGYSFEVEFYGLRNDKLPYEKMNDRYFNKTYAGIYVLEKLRTLPGYFLLNPKPISVSEVFPSTKKGQFKNLRHVGGKLFRCVIRVNNKTDTLNTQARRIESKLHEHTKYSVGSIHNTLWGTYYSKNWIHKGKNKLPNRKEAEFVNKDKLLKLLYSDCGNRGELNKFFNKKDQNNKSNKKSNKKNIKNKPPITDGGVSKKELGAWYARLYESRKETDTNIEISWIIKQGTCYERRAKERGQQNNTRFAKDGLTYLSGIEISNLPSKKNIRVEEMVKEYWTAHEDFDSIIKNGQNTDQCNIYEYTTWLTFKQDMGVIERDIHEFNIQSDDELKKTLMKNISNLKLNFK